MFKGKRVVFSSLTMENVNSTYVSLLILFRKREPIVTDIKSTAAIGKILGKYTADEGKQNDSGLQSH